MSRNLRVSLVAEVDSIKEYDPMMGGEGNLRSGSARRISIPTLLAFEITPQEVGGT